jgi:hypothetical protein
MTAMAKPAIAPGAELDGFAIGERVHQRGMATLWPVTHGRRLRRCRKAASARSGRACAQSRVWTGGSLVAERGGFGTG